jgi:NlpC/P60 family
MKEKIVICLGFLLFAASALSAENPYQDEINAVKARTATLIEHGRERIDQLDQFKNAWGTIEYYANELSELTQMRMDLQAYPNDPTLYSLHEMTFEKVLVDTLQDRLSRIIPKIELSLQTADNVVGQCPDLNHFQNPLKDEILTNLHDLKESIDARKVQAEANLDIWRQWQMEVAFQAEISHQGELIDELTLYNDIGQVKIIFNRLWLDTLHKIYERDYPAARQMLAGYAWFKSIVPLYFADKLTTQDQKDFLTDILNEAEEKGIELTSQYNLLNSIRSWHVFAEEEGGGDHEGHEGGESEDRDHDGGDDDSDKGDFPKSPQEALGQAAGLDPGTNKKFYLQDADGKPIAVLDVSKEVCKYDEAGNGTAKITFEGSGFIERDPEHNNINKVEMSSGPELQKGIDGGISIQIQSHTSGWSTVPCGPIPSNGGPDIKGQSDQFGHMIDHAQSQAKKEEDKQGLRDLKNALQEFERYQNQLNQAVQNRIDHIDHKQTAAHSSAAGLKSGLPPPPPSKQPPPVKPSQILDQLNQIRQSMWNGILSIGGTLSKALGDFIQNQGDHAPPALQGPARGVLDAAHGGQHPSKPLPKITYDPMTPDIRKAILKNAKAIRDGAKIIKYSKVNRTGPDSYDCSGFVSSMYAAAGLPFGTPVVADLLKLAGPNGPFKEISLSDAKPGDLIVWKKGEGKNTYDHVAIYDGDQTVKHEEGPAVISTSDTAAAKGRNAIQEILIKYMMAKKHEPPPPIFIHVFNWKNE